MKLRIKGNSLRLRLSVSEVEEVKKEGLVQEDTHFGPSQRLTYVLGAADRIDVSVEYIESVIRISVPREQLMQWANTNQVGFDAECAIGEEGVVSILVEKDFQCLTDRPMEDESGLFENPRAGQGHP